VNVTIKNSVLASSAAVLLVGVGGGAWAIASNATDPDHPRVETAKDVQPELSGNTVNSPCRIGYDTETSTNVPPDDSTTDNIPAGVVNIKKACSGAVVGTFSTEVSATGAAEFIHLDMRATCTGTGGFAGACTVGQQVFASPGHTFLQNGAGPFGVRSVSEVWTALPKGVWRFEVLPGGNNVASLQFRTFRVETYNAG
jgi:hypothetical protein